MKIFNKWLIKAYGENVKVQGGVVGSFMRKKDAINLLNELTTPLNNGTWESKIDKTIYYKIKKNTKEYK